MDDVRVESLRDVSLTSNVDQYVTHCPNCKMLGKRYDDYKLSLSLEKNVFHCYRCGWSGRVDQLLQGYVNGGALLRYKLDNIDTKQRIKYTSPSGLLIQAELVDLDNISVKIDRSFVNAVEYLRSRNITFEEIKKYDIRIGQGRYRGRIIVPTFDLNNNVVYLVARDYVSENPEAKYINPQGSHKSFAVWNIQNVSTNGKVIITEGVFSGIAANRNTPEDVTAVSIFGKVLADSQARIIASKNPTEISFSFDGDVSRAEIINNYKTLRKFYNGTVTIIKLNGDEDPDNMKPDSYSDRYKKRIEYRHFLKLYFKSFNKITQS